MNITVVGGGNVGTLVAGELTRKNNKVTIYTRDKSKWKEKITVYDKDLDKEYVYSPYLITDDIVEAISNAEVIIITLPAFATRDFINSATKFIRNGTIIGFYPGTGGVEFISRELIEKGCTLFGTQRICSVVRLRKYGEYVVTAGKRKEIFIGAIPFSNGEKVRKFFEDMFEIKTTLLPNYLSVTLTPSNPILHPSRLYTLFKDYNSDKVYDRIPLFYEEWDDDSSSILIKCDDELHKILKEISFDTSYIKPLLSHYESTDVKSLTAKITSIESFKGIETPSVRVDNGYIPDFSSRYFTSDFPYGLVIIKAFALIYKVETPTIDKVILWYQSIVSKEYINIEKQELGPASFEPNLPQIFGINTPSDVEKFYNEN